MNTLQTKQITNLLFDRQSSMPGETGAACHVAYSSYTRGRCNVIMISENKQDVLLPGHPVHKAQRIEVRRYDVISMGQNNVGIVCAKSL